MHTNTPAIMLQGTCSNAGKSLLVAALCRIFAEDGLAPAPFKAQNMALNSFVTESGGELGRAQALQAAACGRAPDTRMNPVLLKPSSDTGSQVVVMGKAVGHMRIAEYLSYKPTAWRAVTAAYDSLASEAGVMVIEGAGSPAEINLKSHDIVNMAMARYAGAAVLLAGDIDRGGVFAALVGTMELLDRDERERIAGFVLNKFRGDAGLLTPALEYVACRTGKPFFGVIPWLADLNLPEEDSVSFKLHGAAETPTVFPGGSAPLDIALVDLPHISNFTDADPLRIEPDVRLRVVRREEELGHPDVVVLPGSKNTTEDLHYLEQCGLAAAVRRLAELPHGPVILGICGGMQMLGSAVHDPLRVESAAGVSTSVRGLDLLPLHTELASEKTVRRVRGTHAPSGYAVVGYEIHHGRTHVIPVSGREHALPCIFDEKGQAVGWLATLSGELEKGGMSGTWGRVWGTYLHGIFEADTFRRAFLDDVRARRGLPPLGHTTRYSIAPALDRLAREVRRHLDMDAIYALLHLRPK